jgi:hypothetical protein
MVMAIIRVTNLLIWVGLTWLIWYAVAPATVELLLGIALNGGLCLITDFVIRVISSEVLKRT